MDSRGKGKKRRKKRGFIEYDYEALYNQNIENLDEYFVEKILEEFINPIAGKKSKGWNIGTLPRKSQIMMRLNTLKRKGIVKYIMVTAKYQDKQGMHEVDLDDLKVSPFMIAKSGTYKVHFTQNSKG